MSVRSTASSSCDVVGDLHRADVGERHAHVLGLAAVVAAGGVRVAEDAADGESLSGLVFSQLRVELALAEEAACRTKMLNGTTTRSPRLQVLHRGADLLDDAGELVAEGRGRRASAHQAVVEVQVRAADAARVTRRITSFGMLDLRAPALCAARTRYGSAIVHCQHGDFLLERSGVLDHSSGGRIGARVIAEATCIKRPQRQQRAETVAIMRQVAGTIV